MTNDKIDIRKILQVFAKTPIPGQVKTRLIPSLGKQGACDLHERLIIRCLQTVTPAFTTQLWCAPEPSHPFFERCRMRFGVSLHRQNGDGLGERMSHALNAGLAVNALPILIGTDCPALSRDYLTQAFGLLERECQAVIGPAEDGGYVLIGIRHPLPELFAAVPWGTNAVLETTRARLRDLRLCWRELPLQWDVDRPADLERCKAFGLWTK
ncbi:MAG: glycosyltransferase [Gammaproteobacteria bacterium]|nr:glycosyltransferase [Gammaproteobacteria bacterium]